MAGFRFDRLVNAPVATVWRDWTEPAELGWFANPGTPDDGSPTVSLQPGGEWRQLMRINADTEYVTGGVYHVIAPDERLTFAWGARDGWPSLEDPVMIEVSLSAAGDGTRVTLTADAPTSFDPDDLPTCNAGWQDTVDRLVAKHESPAPPG